ncbi:MAG: branched-chain amino acid ABC transporter permease, partial [Actinomycetota bacterium]|nr:branched-chain amino acid ABC transporter permease [Actinomycetota bacterium]
PAVAVPREQKISAQTESQAPSPPAKQRRVRKRPPAANVLGLGLVGLVLLWLVVNLIKSPSDFVEIFLIGLTNGAVYGLVAIGYTLVYGILQLINFAHGDVFALSGLVAFTLLFSVLDIGANPPALTIIGAVVVTLAVTMTMFAGINVLVELVGYRRLRNAPRLAPLITAVGMSFIIQNIGLAVYGVPFRSGSELVPHTNVFTVFGVSYQWHKLMVLLVTIPVLAGLTWFVSATRQGKAMRATSQDMEAASVMGINVNRTISITFALAGALAAVAGLLYMVQFNVRYDTGFELGLIAFTAAVLGGIGNLPGAVLGALVIGFIQAFNEGLTWYAAGSDWTRSIVFGILIAILVFRPEGLLGERTPEGN